MVFVRLIATAGGIALGYGAYLMAGCASVALAWSPDGLPWTCLGPDAPNSYPGALASAVVGAAAAMLIATAWMPVLVRRRRNRIHTESSFGENLHRVTEFEDDPADLAEHASTDTVSDQNGSPRETPVGGLRSGVERLERDMSSGALTSGEVTTRWIRLLKEANDLHNDGELPTEDFKQLNTRLLEVPSMLSKERSKALTG